MTPLFKNKNPLRILWMTGLLLFGSRTAQLQNPVRPEMDVSRLIEEAFPFPGEDVNYEEVFELLAQLYETPLNLNTAGYDELASLYILSERQLQALLDYRKELGDFISLYELQAVPELDTATIRRLLPFVEVDTKLWSFKSTRNRAGQSYWMMRAGRILETQRGYTVPDSGSRSTTRYAGGPWQWYGRWRYARTGAYSLGFTVEKDAGEKLEWNPSLHTYGADFYSFHAQIQNRGILKNLIVGDFQVQAGQGLVFSSGFSLGKGTEVIKTVYRGTLGARPYTSAMEAGFFRGVLATVALSDNLHITAFYSRVRRDGTVDSVDSLTESSSISSLSLSGYHRTPTERAKKENTLEQNSGGVLHYAHPGQKLQLGISYLYHELDAYLQKADYPYNYFEMRGKSNHAAGFYGTYRWRNVQSFIEAGRSASGGMGMVGGMLLALSKGFDASFLYRNYQPDFHSTYGNAFGEATRPINEKGMYWGLKYVPNRRWTAAAYYDTFTFPWLKYQVDGPSGGYGYLFHGQWAPDRKRKVSLVINEEVKQKNHPNPVAPVEPLAATRKRTGVLNFEFNRALRYSFRTRAQVSDYSFVGISRSKGWSVAQDAVWRWKIVELSARFTIFHTNDYNSRHYVYERDVLYAFSMPAYYDAGNRHYLMMRLNVNRKIRVWVRWSQTRYSNKELISSGLNEIEGSKRSDIRFQVMYRFD